MNTPLVTTRREGDVVLIICRADVHEAGPLSGRYGPGVVYVTRLGDHVAKLVEQHTRLHR